MPDSAGRPGRIPGLATGSPGRLWVPTGIIKTFDLSMLAGFAPLIDAPGTSAGWRDDLASSPSYVYPIGTGTGGAVRGRWTPPIFDNDSDSVSGTRWRVDSLELAYYRANSSCLIDLTFNKRAAQSGASGGGITTIRTIDATELSVDTGTWTTYSTTFVGSAFNLTDGEGFFIDARMEADTAAQNTRIGTCRVGVRAYILE